MEDGNSDGDGVACMSAWLVVVTWLVGWLVGVVPRVWAELGLGTYPATVCLRRRWHGYVFLQMLWSGWSGFV